MKKKTKQFILFLFSRPVTKEDKYAHFQLKAESISVQFKIFNYVSVEIGCIRISPLDIEIILSNCNNQLILKTGRLVNATSGVILEREGREQT